MLLFVFKGYILPYPPGSLGPEIVATFFFVMIQYVRLFMSKIFFLIGLASVGNKTETTLHLFYSIILAIPVIVGYIYFLRFQTYVLVFDMCFNIIGLIFIAAELLFCLFAILNIKSNEN
jgi:transmembrane protein 216